MNIDVQALARALGGELLGRNILAPGPGHSAADRSLSVKIVPSAPEAFLVHSFAGDDIQDCREHVRTAIRSVFGGCRSTSRPSRNTSAIEPDRSAGRRELAHRLWKEGANPHGTVVATYLASRGLTLPNEIARAVIRFHPRLAFNGASVAGMLALLRDIKTNEPCGLHRTFLDDDGRKLGRKMLGRASGAAIKLDANEHISLGLHIGEGVETCVAAWLSGFRPVWALGSVGTIASFPVLAGVEAITILGEVGDGGANDRASRKCAQRWVAAQREALLVLPRVGGDLNDVWQEAIQ